MLKVRVFEILLVRLGQKYYGMAEKYVLSTATQKYYGMAEKYVLSTATLMEACVVLYQHSNAHESVLYYGTNWEQSFLSSIATRIRNRDIIETAETATRIRNRDIIETVNSSNEF